MRGGNHVWRSGPVQGLLPKALLRSVTGQAPGRVLGLRCAGGLLEDAFASGFFQRLNS